MEHLNKFGARFIFHVKEIPQSRKQTRIKGSFDHIPTVDLTGKLELNSISTEIKVDNSVSRIFKTVEGKRYGFLDPIYPSFIKFATYLSSVPEFINKASEKFILEETFTWVVDSYLSKKIQYELYTYLQKRIEEVSETRTYHFPVMNLHIEEQFEIGNAKFQYFSKEFFDNYYNSLVNPKTSKGEYENHFKQFYGKVVVSCSAKAEARKREELAFAKASLAMDVFRLFSPAIFIPQKVFKVDLEKRISLNCSNSYFSESSDKNDSLLLHFETNSDPFFYDKKTHEMVVQNGLTLFSDFIKNPSQDDLYNLIIQSILFYSFALAIPDIHLRLSQLIMIIEGLLLEEGWVKDLEKKSRMRFCKIIFPTTSIEFKKLNYSLTVLYQIRHQFTHKGIRLPILSERLIDLQVFLVEFLKKLINLNKGLKTKKLLIDYIENS